MKRKKLLILMTAMILIATMNMTAFAYGWGVLPENPLLKTYYTDADNTVHYSDEWVWIDDDGDGIEECYYFWEDGSCQENRIVPTGEFVSTNGAWAINKDPMCIQKRAVGTTLSDVPDTLDKSVEGVYYLVREWRTDIDRDTTYTPQDKNSVQIDVVDDHTIKETHLFTTQAHNIYTYTKDYDGDYTDYEPVFSGCSTISFPQDGIMIKDGYNSFSNSHNYAIYMRDVTPEENSGTGIIAIINLIP